VTTAVGWRAIYERLFEKGPESFSQGERETIRDAIEEAWAAGAAASPSREAPGDLAEIEGLIDAFKRAAKYNASGDVEKGRSAEAAARAALLAAVARLSERLAVAERELVDAADALAPSHEPGATLACGCVVCRCEDPERCHGCGAKLCSAHAVTRLSRNEGTGLAPWYEADGSTVMLPVAEVERRRKLAAKVIGAARMAARVAYQFAGFESWQVPDTYLQALVSTFEALDAASPPPPTPEARWMTECPDCHAPANFEGWAHRDDCKHNQKRSPEGT
jgi:hypothetical protein